MAATTLRPLAALTAVLLVLGLVLEYAVVNPGEYGENHFRLLTAGPDAFVGLGEWGPGGLFIGGLTFVALVTLAAIASAVSVAVRIGSARLSGTLGHALATLQVIGTLLAALLLWGPDVPVSADRGPGIYFLAAGTIGFAVVMLAHTKRARSLHSGDTLESQAQGLLGVR